MSSSTTSISPTFSHRKSGIWRVKRPCQNPGAFSGPETRADPRFWPKSWPNPDFSDRYVTRDTPRPPPWQSVSREAILSRKSSRATGYYPQMRQPPRALRSTRVLIAPPRFKSAPRGLGPCKAPIRNGPFLCHGVPFPNNSKTTTGWPPEILTGLKGCPVAPICEKVLPSKIHSWFFDFLRK